MKGQEILIIGLQSFNPESGSNAKNLAIELAKNNKVLYVNYSFSHKIWCKNNRDPEYFRREEEIKKNHGRLIKKSETLWIYSPEKIIYSINRIRNNWLFNFLNKKNNQKIHAEILNVFSEIDFSAKDLIIINDNDVFRGYYFKELFKPKKYIFYLRDYILGVKYWKNHGKRILPLHIKKADYVFTNSDFLAEYALKHNKNVTNSGQGCDIDHFTDEIFRMAPKEFKHLLNPIIGYSGALDSNRLDITLLENLAIINPTWTFVLIGQEDRKFANSKLHRLDNIKFFGEISYQKLPDYVQLFDVAINPQKMNDLTIGNYPRKIDEYLCMGKPIVATNTPMMDFFKEYVYLAGNLNQWQNQVSKAVSDISEENRVKRRDFGRSHTWDNVLRIISKHI